MVVECISNLGIYDIVKPMFRNFRGTLKLDGVDLSKPTSSWGEGVFAIKKTLFHYHNGFEDWRCAADSDFMGRLYKNKITVLNTPRPLFHRRKHGLGLTSASETNYTSPLRHHYIKISKSRKNFGPLNELKCSKFNEISINRYDANEHYEKIHENFQLKKQEVFDLMMKPKVNIKTLTQEKHVHTTKENVQIIKNKKVQIVQNHKIDVNKKRMEIINKMDKSNRKFFL
jgi:hypothetical protein